MPTTSPADKVAVVSDTRAFPTGDQPQPQRLLEPGCNGSGSAPRSYATAFSTAKKVARLDGVGRAWRNARRLTPNAHHRTSLPRHSESQYGEISPLPWNVTGCPTSEGEPDVDSSVVVGIGPITSVNPLEKLPWLFFNARTKRDLHGDSFIDWRQRANGYGVV